MLDCFSPASAADGATPIDLVTTANFEAWSKGQTPFAANWAKANEFAGQAGRILTIPSESGEREKLVIGMGKGDDPLLAADLSSGLDGGTFRFDYGAEQMDGLLLALAWALGTYQFTAYRKNVRTAPRLVMRDSAFAETVSHICEGVFLTRDLVNTPANDMGPEELERAARDLAERHKAEFRSIIGEDLLAKNFPLIHAVGRASTRAPRLIDITWGDPSAPKLTLVGKGVCFDSGGLNLKPGAGMELMKKDMGGGAHVLGLAHMIMAQNLPVRLRVLVPAVENAISGNAFRPGDVYRSRKGITVEIGNTDAEGRLVLADAIALGDEEAPDCMLVMATLTGAARVALGPDVIPFYTDDNEFAAEIADNSAKALDPAWRMPLHKPYLATMESRIADINHISGGKFAGSVTAALFLQKFSSKAKQWAHFDIYAWNATARPGKPIGGEAQVIRALFNLFEARYRKSAGKPQAQETSSPRAG